MYKKTLDNFDLFCLMINTLNTLTDPWNKEVAVKAFVSLFINTEKVFNKDEPFVLLSEVFSVLDRFGVAAEFPLIEAITKAANLNLMESYSIIFNNIPNRKIPIIKWLRGHSTLGIKEAKDLVEKGYEKDSEGNIFDGWNGLEWPVLTGNKNKIDRAVAELEKLGFGWYYVSNTVL